MAELDSISIVPAHSGAVLSLEKPFFDPPQPCNEAAALDAPQPREEAGGQVSMTRSDSQAAESSLNDSRDPFNVCSPFTAGDASPILPENPDEW